MEVVPSEEGCRITPRAGVVSVCSFTMTAGGEVDGMVLALLEQSGEVPLSGVRVDLLAEGPGGGDMISGLDFLLKPDPPVQKPAVEAAAGMFQ